MKEMRQTRAFILAYVCHDEPNAKRKTEWKIEMELVVVITELKQENNYLFYTTWFLTRYFAQHRIDQMHFAGFPILNYSGSGSNQRVQNRNSSSERKRNGTYYPISWDPERNLAIQVTFHISTHEIVLSMSHPFNCASHRFEAWGKLSVLNKRDIIPFIYLL